MSRFAPVAPRPKKWPLALTLALALTACSKPPPDPEPLRSVKLLTVGASAQGGATEFSAEVRPQVETRLGFRVAGKIAQRQAEMGQRVRAGQLLAELDAQDYQLATDAARAQVVAATTQRDLAAADWGRYKSLRDENFISGAELERRETSLKAAQADLDQAETQLRVQGNQASYTRLVAPAPGVITSVEAEPGQVVSTGATVVRLAQDGPRDAVFYVPEDQVGAVRVGSEVLVRAWSGGGAVTGKVREVAASADTVTRTFMVKVGLPASASMPLGATVVVVPKALSNADASVIKLPLSALRQEGNASAVWVLEPATMTLRSQPVQVATFAGNEAVVSVGLAPGMQVVSSGVHVLSAGQKVSIFQAVR